MLAQRALRQRWWRGAVCRLAKGVGLDGAGAGFLSFAGLLRRLRGEAKLTQEELAEAAGLSLRAVSDLERGIHPTARKDTALLLARALGMTESAAVLFVAAARGRTPAGRAGRPARLRAATGRDDAPGMEHPGP